MRKPLEGLVYTPPKRKVYELPPSVRPGARVEQRTTYRYSPNRTRRGTIKHQSEFGTWFVVWDSGLGDWIGRSEYYYIRVLRSDER